MIDLQLSAQLETIYAHIIRMSLQQIAICSLQAHSGNTTLALALARRAASSGKNVLALSGHAKLLASSLNNTIATRLKRSN